MAETIVQMLISGQDDIIWFESNLSYLKSKYDNRFIAFHNKEVIESDTNLDNLLRKLHDKNVDTSNIFIKFISKIKSIL